MFVYIAYSVCVFLTKVDIFITYDKNVDEREVKEYTLFLFQQYMFDYRPIIPRIIQ